MSARKTAPDRAANFHPGHANLPSLPVIPPRGPRLDFPVNVPTLFTAEALAFARSTPPGRAGLFTTSPNV